MFSRILIGSSAFAIGTGFGMTMQHNIENKNPSLFSEIPNFNIKNIFAEELNINKNNLDNDLDNEKVNTAKEFVNREAKTTKYIEILDFKKPVNLSNLKFDKITELHNVHDKNYLQKFPNVKKITFSESFNEKLEYGDIPKGVEYIKFGYSFNQSVDPDYYDMGMSIFPESVEKIEFGHEFNQPIGENAFPKNLKEVIFGYDFEQKLNQRNLPNSIETILIENRYYVKLSIKGKGLSNLKEVYIGGCVQLKLPRYKIDVDSLREGVNISQMSAKEFFGKYRSVGKN